MYTQRKSIILLVILNVTKAISSFAFIIGVEKLINTIELKNAIYICVALFLQYMISALIQYTTHMFGLKEFGKRDFIIEKKIKKIDYSVLENKECQDKISVFRTTYEKEITAANSISDSVYGLTNGILFVSYLFVNMNAIIAFINSLLLLIILSFTCLTENKMSNFMYDYWEKYKKNTRLYNAFSDVLLKRDYVEERKIFKFSLFFSKNFNDEFIKATNCNDKMGKKRMQIELLSEVCVISFLFCQFFILLFSVRYNYLSVSVFVAIMSYLTIIFSGITDGLYALPEIIRMHQMKKKFCEFIEDKTIERIIEMSKSNDTKYAVEIEDISFSYDNNPNIINHLSCKLEKGKKYALIGINGAGKTTLVKLICGLYQVDSGKLRVNGNVKVLFQDFNKYPYTLEENILLGNNDENLNEIIERVGLDNLNLTNNTKTKLNTIYLDGVDLSGGQWQKIALSRLLNNDSDIIILDEPTSNLDPLMETKIFEEYLPFLKDKTVIIISHRLGNIKGLDQIIAMNNGTIYEKGTHEELMKNNDSLYRTMYEKQKSLFF